MMGTSVPTEVQQAEDKLVKDAPVATQAEATKVEADINSALGDAAGKGAQAQDNLKAYTADKDPALAGEAEALDTGNYGAVIGNFAGAVNEVKAGYKTTEFWLVLVALILTQISALHVPGKYGETIQTTALIASYALSRGIAKRQ